MTDLDRTIILSSGARRPLFQVAQAYASLAIELEESSPGLIYHLRQLCLGVELPTEHRGHLRKAGLLKEDDSLDPTLRDVVLASVRGEGQAIYLVSPFTDSWDRSISELLAAKNRIRADLHREEAERLISAPNPLQQMFDNALQHLSKHPQEDPDNWVDRATEARRLAQQKREKE